MYLKGNAINGNRILLEYENIYISISIYIYILHFQSHLCRRTTVGLFKSV